MIGDIKRYFSVNFSHVCCAALQNSATEISQPGINPLFFGAKSQRTNQSA
jgi:hypothetical protein